MKWEYRLTYLQLCDQGRRYTQDRDEQKILQKGSLCLFPIGQASVIHGTFPLKSFLVPFITWSPHHGTDKRSTRKSFVLSMKSPPSEAGFQEKGDIVRHPAPDPGLSVAPDLTSGQVRIGDQDKQDKL